MSVSERVVDSDGEDEGGGSSQQGGGPGGVVMGREEVDSMRAETRGVWESAAGEDGSVEMGRGGGRGIVIVIVSPSTGVGRLSTRRSRASISLCRFASREAALVAAGRRVSASISCSRSRRRIAISACAAASWASVSASFASRDAM